MTLEGKREVVSSVIQAKLVIPVLLCYIVSLIVAANWETGPEREPKIGKKHSQDSGEALKTHHCITITPISHSMKRKSQTKQKKKEIVIDDSRIGVELLMIGTKALFSH